jgi:hypothetical protein
MGAIEELIHKINYLNIEKDTRDLYAKLKQSTLFKETRGYPDIFLLCMAIGLKDGKKKKITKSSNLFRVYELGNDIWILLSVAQDILKELGVFKDKSGAIAAFKLCEEYANRGAEILSEMIKKDKNLSQTLLNELSKVKNKLITLELTSDI